MAAWTDCSVVGAPRVGSSFQLAGKEYVSIAQWAEQQTFESHWTRRDESVQLTRNGSTINLTVDSRDAHINGVQVWLLFPAVFRNGSIYISKLDLEATLRPVLFPPKNRAGARVKNICLDPGHGGREPGNLAGAARGKK